MPYGLVRKRTPQRGYNYDKKASLFSTSRLAYEALAAGRGVHHRTHTTYGRDLGIIGLLVEPRWPFLSAGASGLLIRSSIYVHEH